MGMMSIRAIGAPSGASGAVAGAYLDYLTSGIEMEGQVAAPSLDGTMNYYDSGIEGPGMWHGHGAERLGLSGFVDVDDLDLVLQGRHHETGERLLSASGSAGRHSLKVGEATRMHEGNPVWSHHDLATHLGVTDDELADLTNTVGVSPFALDEGDHFTFSDVESLAELLDIKHTATKLNAIGDDDLLNTGTAAEALGVSRQYLSMVIGRYHEYEKLDTPIEDRMSDWLPARRTDPSNPKSHWRIKGEDLKAFAERREQPAVRLAYDVTFSVEKSISVVGLLSDGGTRDVFTQAITDANRTALDHLDQYASDGRERQRPIGSEGLTVASFMHATSRNNDPFLHVHNLVANSIEDANGQGRALDARNLYLQGPTASALGSIQLRWELSQRLGLQWHATSNSVEIAGVDKDLIDGFSTGRNRIESIVEEAGIDLSDSASRAKAQRESRPNKTTETPESLLEEWWDRADDLGFSRDTLTELLSNAHELPAPELSTDEQAALNTHLESAHGATRNASIFTRSDVLRSIGEWSPDGQHVRVMPAEVADQAATDFLTSHLVVPLDIDKDQVAKLVGKVSPALHQRDVFTTKRVLDSHHNIDRMWTYGLSAEKATLEPSTVKAAITDADTLNAAQTDLINQWTSSGHQFQSAVGVPGAGKTFAVSAAARAWEAQGYEVLGAAISGTAAQTLGTEADIPTDTVASYLKQIYRDGNNPLHNRSVLIVDEAGTLGDRDLESLMVAAEATGASIRLLGDPAQHASVEAGGMWHHLTETYAANTPALLHSYRFQDSPVDVEANQLARNGHIKEAFDILRNNGQLTEVDSREQALSSLLRRSVEARDAGTPAPMIERTNASRVALNAAMQSVRAQRDEVTNLTQFGIRKYGVGDEIVSRATQRQLSPNDNPDAYLRNGTQGVITAIDHHPNRDVAPVVTADFGSGPIVIPGDRFTTDLFDLGYALTSHAVQGATLPLSHSSVSAGATNAEYVVNLSRGKQNNHLVLVGDTDEEMSRFYDRPEPQHLGDRLADSVSPSDAIPATAADTAAGYRDTNLARLNARDAHPNDIAYARSVQRRQIIANPPTALTGQLPPAIDIPHLAHGQTNAVVNAALYQQTYKPYPAEAAPYGNVLGARPDPNNASERQVASYDRALDALTNSATRTAMRHIHSHDDQVPSWVNDHVAALASNGELTARFDVDVFTQWTHAAHTHQTETGFFPTGPPPPDLTDPKARARHEALAKVHATALNPPQTATLALDTSAGLEQHTPTPRPRALQL